jgi:diguanylate cyclase (GGDEF)-like protein
LDLSIAETQNMIENSIDNPYYKRLEKYLQLDKTRCIIMKLYIGNAPKNEIDEKVKLAAAQLKDLVETDIVESELNSLCTLISLCSQLCLYGYTDIIGREFDILIEKAKNLPYISKIMEATINYAESFRLFGEERVKVLMDAVRNAGEMKLYMILANASMLLSKYYDGKNKYLSLDYCVKACEAVRNQVNNTPVKRRPALIKSYGLFEPFLKVMEEMDVEYPGLTPEEVIMNPKFYENLRADDELVRLGRETYLSKMPVKIKNINDILEYSGGRAEEIINITVDYIAALALGSCFIATETEEGTVNVIASSGGNTGIYGSALFNRAKNSGLLMAGKDINRELLPEGVKAVACISLNMGIKSAGYIVISTDSLLHNINETLISECRQLFPLCAINVTLLSVQAGVILDKLSGVLNRKHLDLALDYYIEKAAATNSVFSVVMLDIDRFKGINDTYGHSTGDRVIRSLGDFLRKNLRKETPVGRYGGEEFVIVLDNATSENAFKAAEKLRIALEEAKLLGFKRSVTGSLGIATYGEHGITKDELIHKADLALYMCKERGRNRCEVYDSSFESTAKITKTARNIISSDLVKSAMRMRITLEIIEMSKTNTDRCLYLEKIKALAEADDCEYSTDTGELKFTADESTDKSTVSIPVRKGGKTVGLLHLTDKLSKHRYDENDSEFLYQLADLFALSEV